MFKIMFENKVLTQKGQKRYIVYYRQGIRPDIYKINNFEYNLLKATVNKSYRKGLKG